MKGHTSVMPLNGKMGHVEKRSQKVVLDVPVLKMAVVPRPRAGMDNAAPRGLEAATATTAAELAAAATNAAPENEKNKRIIGQAPLGHKTAERGTTWMLRTCN